MLGRSEVVKYLTSIGANKNAKNKYGSTPYDATLNNNIKKSSNKFKHFLKCKRK